MSRTAIIGTGFVGRAWAISFARAGHEEMKTRYLANISLRRMTSPWDVAAMVAFLLSDAGVNVSGQSLGVDGNVEAL